MATDEKVEKVARGSASAKARRRGRKRLEEAGALQRAFARAAAEAEELRRLKASGKPWACLDFGREPVLVPPVGSPADRVDAGTAADGAANESALVAAR
jgi:hypothetical protein